MIDANSWISERVDEMLAAQGDVQLTDGERAAVIGVLEGAVQALEPGIRAIKAECDRYRAALLVAADDLDKAANQFAGIAAWERSDSAPHVVANPHLFAEKAARARAAASDAPAPADAAASSKEQPSTTTDRKEP